MVLVADSPEARMDANIESLGNLDKNLVEHGFDLAPIGVFNTLKAAALQVLMELRKKQRVSGGVASALPS